MSFLELTLRHTNPQFEARSMSDRHNEILASQSVQLDQIQRHPRLLLLKMYVDYTKARMRRRCSKPRRPTVNVAVYWYTRAPRAMMSGRRGRPCSVWKVAVVAYYWAMWYTEWNLCQRYAVWANGHHHSLIQDELEAVQRLNIDSNESLRYENSTWYSAV